MKNVIGKEKQLICILLVVAALMAVFVGGMIPLDKATVRAEGNATYSIDMQSTIIAGYGGDIVLTIKVANTSGFKFFGAECELNYNPAVFTVKSAKADAAFISGSINIAASPSMVKVAIDTNNDTAQIAKPNFNVATVVFTLKSGAAAGNYDFSLTGAVASTFENPEMTIPAVGGSKTVAVQPASTEADMLTIALRGGGATIAGGFLSGGSGAVSGSVYKATADVPYSTSSISIQTTISPNASIKFKGSGSSTVNLNVGENAIPVEVTAQDGTTKKTFTIKITRLAGSTNNDITLVLKNSSGVELVLNADGDKYVAQAPVTFANKDSLRVVCTVAATSKLNIAGADVASGADIALKLVDGLNQVPIVVTAENGTKKNYTIEINVTTPQVSNTLATLEIKYPDGRAIDLRPLFSPDTTMYFVSLEHGTEKIIVTATPSDPLATIEDHGVGEIPAVEGLITITVVAQNGEKKNYMIAMIILSEKVEADKSDQVIVNGNDVGFKNDNFHYDVNLTWKDKDVQLEYKSNNEVKTEVIGEKDLLPGRNTVLLNVVQADGSILTYTFDVYKPDIVKLILFTCSVLFALLFAIMTIALIVVKSKKNKMATPPGFYPPTYPGAPNGWNSQPGNSGSMNMDVVAAQPAMQAPPIAPSQTSMREPFSAANTVKRQDSRKKSAGAYVKEIDRRNINNEEFNVKEDSRDPDCNGINVAYVNRDHGYSGFEENVNAKREREEEELRNRRETEMRLLREEESLRNEEKMRMRKEEEEIRMLREKELRFQADIDKTDSVKVNSDNEEIEKETDEEKKKLVKTTFENRLITTTDEIKNEYNNLKNLLLSYLGVIAITSKAGEIFKVKIRNVAKINVINGTIKLSLLSSDQVAQTKGGSNDLTIDIVIKTSADMRNATALVENAMKCVNAKKNEGYTYVDFIKEIDICKNATFVRKGNETLIRRSVDVITANRIVDDISTAYIADEIMDNSEKGATKSVDVYLDTLSSQFPNRAEIRLENMVEKGIIERGVNYVKIQARGILNKSFSIYAQDFSNEALKMIAITGGCAIKLVRK